MKCLRCGARQTPKPRPVRCARCQHPFVFVPARGSADPFSDRFFDLAVARLSDGGELKFTRAQLVYLLDDWLKSNQLPFFAGATVLESVGALLGGAVLLLAIAVAAIASSPSSWLALPLLALLGGVLLGLTARLARAALRVNFFPERTNHAVRRGGAIALLGGGGLLALAAGVLPYRWTVVGAVTGAIALLGSGIWTLQRARLLPQVPDIDAEQLDAWIARWEAVNAPLPAIAGSEATVTLNPDSDCAVICQSDRLAQLLIANDVPARFDCTVLSASGAPAALEMAIATLRRNPTLAVYALHDASPEGVGLVPCLQFDPDWFAGDAIVIYDLGLLPRQILRQGEFAIRRSPDSAARAAALPEEIRAELSAAERVWLDAGNFVELESLSPARVLKMLGDGMANSVVPSRLAATVADTFNADESA